MRHKSLENEAIKENWGKKVNEANDADKADEANYAHDAKQTDEEIGADEANYADEANQTDEAIEIDEAHLTEGYLYLMCAQVAEVEDTTDTYLLSSGFDLQRGG